MTAHAEIGLLVLLTVDEAARLLRTTRKARYSALRDHRHLRGLRVLYQDDGRPQTEKTVQTLVLRAARRAGLKNNGRTFCGTRSVHISRCAAHPFARFRNLPDTRISRRPSATCT